MMNPDSIFFISTLITVCLYMLGNSTDIAELGFLGRVLSIVFLSSMICMLISGINIGLEGLGNLVPIDY